MSEALRLTYILHCAPGESAESKARDIGLEQTVELPHELVAGTERDAYAGRVEQLEQLDETTFRTRIAYRPETVAGELPQLLNVLFGNISLKDGIEVVDIDWPPQMLDNFGGPGHGVAGLRRETGVHGRPLLCTALKPMGLDAGSLAEICRQFALGGVDLIKDDHGLTDQPAAPFADRLAACQQAVERANGESGGGTLYLPNVTAGRGTLEQRVEAAAGAGCRGVLLCPMLTGIDALAWIRDRFGLIVMAHPSLTGSYFRRTHGIRPELLLGELFRVAGADASIYPNAGGRFGFSAATCEALNDRLRRPLGDLQPAMPTVGGGITIDGIPGWSQRYGSDTIFLIGGGLYAQHDLRAASQALIGELERHHG